MLLLVVRIFSLSLAIFNNQKNYFLFVIIARVQLCTLDNSKQ